MAVIIPFLRAEENVFHPKDIVAMSMALDDVCKTLNLKDDSAAREVMAVRIIAWQRLVSAAQHASATESFKRRGTAERIGVDGGAGGISDA
jgi:hypothetical protein